MVLLVTVVVDLVVGSDGFEVQNGSLLEMVVVVPEDGNVGLFRDVMWLLWWVVCGGGVVDAAMVVIVDIGGGMFEMMVLLSGDDGGGFGDGDSNGYAAGRYGEVVVI
ncbi:Hypothetical predicted protein [Olea europaea subsp. europaea]|uniref:Uncharacterized protein n=1 Tax=Olea europaea subsp. europaea TaxID=158383 RepID=A0A8S0RL71_OLEEU|nr:Hypothetical predicted protein [Olea europaea subsp. europaea]